MDHKITHPIRRLLIANRGEIACRIIRTAKKLGIYTIAVYTGEDQHAKHCLLADEAHYIGQGSLSHTYLDSDRIIKTAQISQADAIHPGYGFLSENAEFATRCQQAKLIFVGPSAQAIAQMAVKDVAKNIMRQAQVPVVPGYEGSDQSLPAFQNAADQIGYPVLLKAAKGGGGKGMRIVKEAAALAEAIQSAKRESFSSFGDDSLFIEKYIHAARHIEVQIFRDSHGQTVHLFERDCSLQRRHQKIIEESPAIGLTTNLKEQLYAAATRAADAIDYLGAGTIEFLCAPNGEFYFMEMNTRLQVEHPVTEMITGIDLVEWQILIAEGKPIPLKQTKIISQGHAIEARIYAEDPHQGFLPATGIVKAIFLPSIQHYRLDTALQAGDSVGIHFDPMLAKLIVHANSRADAIQQLAQALSQYELVGITNNITFLQAILQNTLFQNGEIHTQSLEKHLSDFLPPLQPITITGLAIASLLLVLSRHQIKTDHSDPFSPWNMQQAWRLNATASEWITLYSQSQSYSLMIEHLPANIKNMYSIRIFWPAQQQSLTLMGRLKENQLQIQFSDQQLTLPCYCDETMLAFIYANQHCTFSLTNDGRLLLGHEDHISHIVRAPMPGVLTKIWVKSGDKVAQGEKLLALEAMKMEHTLTATSPATIKSIRFDIGDQVEEGCELIDFE